MEALNWNVRVAAAYLLAPNPDPWSDIELAVFADGIENWDLRDRASAMVQVQKEAGNLFLNQSLAFKNSEVVVIGQRASDKVLKVFFGQLQLASDFMHDLIRQIAFPM